MSESPWLNLREGAGYIRRGPRWLARQVEAGRCRAARVGGRRELLFRREWLDEFVEDLSTPVLVHRRRGG